MEASKLLLQSAELLKQDTKSKEGRDMLVVAIQTILSGITNVLDIYDETEIRKIKAISQYIRELIDSTNQEKSVQDSISTLRQLSQCSMALAAQVNNRIPELLSHQSQLRLRISVNTISKITPLLLNSYKAILKNFDSDSITTSKCIICNILKRTCQDIDNIVSDDDSKTIETSKVKKNNLFFFFKFFLYDIIYYYCYLLLLLLLLLYNLVCHCYILMYIFIFINYK